jgi:isopentenyl diphosphate isomerase/L-lactate dehydrogenase-like FMN-dependent dehydrogenase
MLPEIVEGIVKKGNKVEVYVDGGIRYGSDVIKCLALGARYVFLGRPVLFSNTYDGEKGINLMLEILEKDMRIDMTLLGVEKISQINHKCIITNHMTSRL